MQYGKGGVQYGKGGGKRAMDGSWSPETLPQLPGSDVPSNNMVGKWKLVIHTVGTTFLRNAKVFVDQVDTGYRVEDWLSYVPRRRWKRFKNHLTPGTQSHRELCGRERP